MRIGGAIVVLSTSVLFACATPGPYAEVIGEKLTVADTTAESVKFLGVNGRLIASGAFTVTLDPGSNMLIAQTTRSDGRRRGPDAVLPLNAKPCMRYYVIARHESQSLVEPWSLEITKVESIAECLAKYPGDVASK